jgi:hypothetical protein
MRRLLHPTVALLTFCVGVAAVMVWYATRLDTRIRSTAAPTVNGSPGNLPQANPEIEKYAVYAALIKNMYLEEGVKLLVITEATGCVTPSDDKETENYFIEKLPELSPETLDDFRHQSRQCRTLSGKFELPVKYVLITGKDLQPLNAEGEIVGFWQRFYARYPDSSGLLSFSNVGFNREMTQALVSTTRGCGGLCGAGYYVLLRKERGQWIVRYEVTAWIS